MTNLHYNLLEAVFYTKHSNLKSDYQIENNRIYLPYSMHMIVRFILDMRVDMLRFRCIFVCMQMRMLMCMRMYVCKPVMPVLVCVQMHM